MFSLVARGGEGGGRGLRARLEPSSSVSIPISIIPLLLTL